MGSHDNSSRPSSSLKQQARFLLGLYLFIEGVFLFVDVGSSKYCLIYEQAFKNGFGEGIFSKLLPVFVMIFAIAGSLMVFANNKTGYYLAMIVFALQLIFVHLGLFSSDYMKDLDAGNNFYEYNPRDIQLIEAGKSLLGFLVAFNLSDRPARILHTSGPEGVATMKSLHNVLKR